MNKKVRLLVSVFLILYFTSGFLVSNDIISSAGTIAGWVFILILSFFSFEKKGTNEITVVALTILCFILSSFFNSEPLFRTVALIFAFFTAGIFSISTTFDDFKEAYVKVLAVLSAVSFVLFILYQIFPSLLNLNVVYNSDGFPASNLYIYIGTDLGRNMGMFWEPGAFQAFIAVALLFTITEPKINFKLFVLFAATIATTFSTTGYIALLVVFIMFIARWKSLEKSTKRKFMYLAIPMLVVFLYLGADILFDTNSNTAIGKLLMFREQGGLQGDVDTGSVAVRYFAIIKPIEAFFSSPLFGMGCEGLKKELDAFTFGMNTCTFVNWFAMYGIGYGLLMVIGIAKLSKKIYPSQRWLIFLFFFIITISEDFATNAFFYVLVLMGYKKEPNFLSKINEQ